MATNIKTLKDVNGDTILPRTRADAITMADGLSNAETEINNKAEKPSLLTEAVTISNSDIVSIETAVGLKKMTVATLKSLLGINSGGIVESGSNANGSYVKFGDGTMICTGSMSFSNHVQNTKATKLWVFPVPFLASYSHNVFATLRDFNSSFDFALNYITASSGDKLQSSITMSIGDSVAIQTYEFGLLAIGKYK